MHLCDWTASVPILSWIAAASQLGSVADGQLLASCSLRCCMNGVCAATAPHLQV